MSPTNAVKHLAKNVADQIADYRRGEVPQPTPAHVERWVNQFDELARETLLEEVSLLLRQFYFTERLAYQSLDRLLFLPDLVGTNPRDGLRRVRFLDIQRKGQSQKALLQ